MGGFERVESQIKSTTIDLEVLINLTKRDTDVMHNHAAMEERKHFKRSTRETLKTKISKGELGYERQIQR